MRQMLIETGFGVLNHHVTFEDKCVIICSFLSKGILVDTSMKQSLKAQAHHLKPVVMIGSKGLTPAIILETEAAIKAHELIKIKISGFLKKERSDIAQELSQAIQAELLQIIGTIAIVYKKNEDAKK